MLFEKLGMVIAAGGSGSRFSKTVNKLLVEYQGKPLMIHALETFLPVLEPGNMVIAASAFELENMRRIAEKYLPGNPIKWVVGGATRLASVVNAVAAVLLFMVFTSLIGVCASSEMRCQTTKLWGIGAAAVVFATSLINLFSGKEGQVPG